MNDKKEVPAVIMFFAAVLFCVLIIAIIWAIVLGVLVLTDGAFDWMGSS